MWIEKANNYQIAKVQLQGAANFSLALFIKVLLIKSVAEQLF